MRKAYLIFILALVVMSSLQGCNGGKATEAIEGAPVPMKYSRLLEMRELQEGITLVDLRNPWDTSTYLGHYALVDEYVDNLNPIPKQYTRLKVPIHKSIVYSGIHTALLDELNAIASVSGVCDTTYITDHTTLERVRNGVIKDCGRHNAPNMERIVTLQPEIILLSPFQNSDDAGRFEKIGINVVQASDYMESTPLGRAEWMRFIGRLYGKGEMADSIFNSIEEKYNKLKESVKKSGNTPGVMFDRIYSGIWDTPTGGSVTGRLIEDAGGKNPFDKYQEGGSAHLSAEEVLHTAHDADVWIIRYSGPEITLQSLGKENPIYPQFRSYKEGNIYISNTLTSGLFEDGAFHPEKILEEMIRIIQPEIVGSPLVYYKKIRS